MLAFYETYSPNKGNVVCNISEARRWKLVPSFLFQVLLRVACRFICHALHMDVFLSPHILQQL